MFAGCDATNIDPMCMVTPNHYDDDDQVDRSVELGGEQEQQMAKRQQGRIGNGGSADNPEGSPRTSLGSADLIAEWFGDASADEDVPQRDERAAGLAVRSQEEWKTSASRTASMSREADGRGRGQILDRVSREAIGLIAVVVLALVCAGLLGAVVVKTRSDAAAAAKEAASYTPPPTSTQSPDVTGPVIAIIGDDALTVSAPGVTENKRWPLLLGKALGARITLLAGPASGYTSTGAGGATFVDRVSDVPSNAELVLFVGGAADARSSRLEVARAATQAFGEAARQAPRAQVVAVGPLFAPTGATSAEVKLVRDSLRSAARITEIRFIDPVASGWLADVGASKDLSLAHEKAIVRRLQAPLEAELS